MALLKRVLALLTGWLLVSWGLGMAGAGHALWQMFGASTIYVGLLQAAALVVVGDAIFVGLLVAKGGERAKVVVGFFAVAGIFLSVGAFGAIRSAWRAGM
jgi:hypothetical protein